VKTSLSEIIKDLNFLSDRISTQVRSIALGLIALVWALLVGSDTQVLSLGSASRPHLLAIGLLGVLIMFLDYLQYVFGYLNTNKTRKTAEEDADHAAAYNYRSRLYMTRTFFFWAKQALVAIAVVWFGVVVGLLLLKNWS
jgi:hypothetical protein